MRVLRGQTPTLAADRRVVEALITYATEADEPVVRVWQPLPQIAFGRRDATLDGYERARRIAAERGYKPVERSVGGRAVAFTGTTLAFAHSQPVDDPRCGLNRRYDNTSSAVREALANLGVDTRPGEPDRSFCPGSHSLQSDGKIVGIAQRVRNGAALVSGIVVVRDHEAIASVLDPIYETLDVSFDPTSVSSLARSGPNDPETVARTIEASLVGEQDWSVEDVEDEWY